MANRNEVRGDRGNNLLEGGNKDEVLLGLSGDDTLIGGRGNDTMNGGGENDRMIWNNGDGSDQINGGTGFDIVEVNDSGARGDDFVLKQRGKTAVFQRTNFGQFQLDVRNVDQFEVNATGGNDRLTIQNLAQTEVQFVRFSGGEGNDTLDASRTAVKVTAFGGNGDDSLAGGAADDVITGDRGSDTMLGGDGNDRLIWNNGDGSDVMRGGNGTDVIEVNGAGGSGDQFTLQQIGGIASFDRVNLVPFNLNVDDAEQFEINGGGGDDSLQVGDLSATDVVQVKFTGGDGEDTLNASASSTTIVAEGGAGNDSLTGSSVADTLQGDDGDDVVVGGRGNDRMIGGTGNDRLIWNNGDGSDQMSGNEGTDVIEVNGSGASGDAFTLNQSGTNAIFDRVNLVPFKLTVDSAEQFEVNGLGGDDTFEVNDLSATDVVKVSFDGGDGNDSFNGRNTAVQLVLSGGAGSDTLIGGAADDTLTGGTGNDFLDGGAGNDRFVFEGSNPFAQANLGVDTLTFAAGDKIVLDKAVFSALSSDIGNGFGVANEFAVVNNDAAAATSNALIVYSRGTGNLFYNQNKSGSGLGGGGQFAALRGAPNLAATDFVIQAQVSILA